MIPNENRVRFNTNGAKTMTLNAEYLALTSVALIYPTEANIDAVNAFKAAHPNIVDVVYHDAGAHEYDVLTATVHKV